MKFFIPVLFLLLPFTPILEKGAKQNPVTKISFSYPAEAGECPEEEHTGSGTPFTSGDFPLTPDHPELASGMISSLIEQRPLFTRPEFSECYLM